MIDELFEEWMEEVEASAGVPENLTAFNFGLFETPDGYCMYLMGAKVYDRDDPDWACEEDFTPEARYLPLPFEVLSGEPDWEEFLVMAVKCVSRYIDKVIAHPGMRSMFRDKIVTCGFDDGDLVRII